MMQTKIDIQFREERSLCMSLQLEMKAYLAAAVEELQDGDIYCREQIEPFYFV